MKDILKRAFEQLEKKKPLNIYIYIFFFGGGVLK